MADCCTTSGVEFFAIAGATPLQFFAGAGESVNVEFGCEPSALALEMVPFLKGDKGVPGDPGTPGTPGGAGYEHTQSSAASTWTVTHNLGRHPSVTVVDSAGTEIDAELQYVSTNQLILKFGFSFAGKAFLN